MKKIVIIGAGPSGLTAGLELIRKGYEVTILEASDAIGGISQTIHHNDQRIDIGGHRFFSKDARVMAWWNEILPYQGSPSRDDKKLGRKARLVEGGPDPEKTDEVFLIRHRISRIYYNHRFFDYPISFSFQTFRNMGLSKTFTAGCSYLTSCVRKLPEDNLENFYINRFGKKLYSMFFEGYTTKVWGRTPAEISADWGAQRVKGVSIAALIANAFGKIVPGKNRKVETSLIEEFYYPKYGPGQLWETVAKRFTEAGGTLLMDREVTGLERDAEDPGRIVGVQCADGTSYACDAVFSSMPLCQLVTALGDVPQEVSEIAAGLPYRDFVTVGLLVDKLNLKNETRIPTLGNIVPDCWIYVQDAEVNMGRIQIFNNWSPYMLKDPEHSVWIGLEYFCQEGDAFWNLSEKETVRLAVRELRKIGVLGKKTSIMDSCRARIKKAYPAYFDTYSRIDTLTDYLNGFDNLYCIGRNGQHRYNNMDHSMVTAFTAIDCLEGRADRTDLWNVNTEQEYHEEKNEAQ
ncbi:MAG: NAD(P)/FAD-dependent oxidoreductase [Eubacteriales bacterium]|nr:NAD(P)/FAD-dependent oxidoreductase [Eubacteriales bacterium]